MKELAPPAGTNLRTIRYWSDCRCLEETPLQQQIKAESDKLQVEVRGHGARQSDIRQIRGLRMEDFDRNALTAPEGGHPLDIAQRWLDAVLPKLNAASYREGPPVALYFHSPGRGRGKTHIAGGMANLAHSKGKRCAFVDEITFLDTYLAASLEKKSELTLGYAEPWLTVLDDMGQRDNAPPSLRDAYYAVINPRWLGMRWTIVTSNYTPRQLLDRGTLSDASYSRLMQMTRGKLIAFNGDDYRLKGTTPQ